jgi:hypothetical protein
MRLPGRTLIAQSPDDFAILLLNRQGTPDPQYLWLAIAGHRKWKEPEYDRVVLGLPGTLKMWVNVRSFLVRREDRAEFIERASQKNFYGKGVRFPEQHSGWIGEYPWSRAFRDMRGWCAGEDSLVGDVGVPYTTTACSWPGGSTLVPSPQLCDTLSLEWAGEGGAFQTDTGELIVGHLGGDAADWGRMLLIREDALKTGLNAAGLDLVWCVVAERSCWCTETTTHVTKTELEVSAVYWMDGESIQGGLTKTLLQRLGRS